jgi:hypothetical protein
VNDFDADTDVAVYDGAYGKLVEAAVTIALNGDALANETSDAAEKFLRDAWEAWRHTPGESEGAEDRFDSE